MYGQHMEIIDYTDNKGIIPIDMGQAKIIINNKYFLHAINTSSYPPIIDHTSQNLAKHLEIMNNNTQTKKLFATRIRVINKNLETLKQTYEYMKPRQSNRPKRGIHIIFGDIQQADLSEIQSAMRQVHTNENMLVSKLNEQVQINNKMINRFREIEDKITGENKAITEGINKIAQDQHDINFKLICEQSLHQIEYTIYALQNHLDNILDAITLAKQNHISHYLLSNDEIHLVTQMLEKQGITIETEYELFQFLSVNILFKNPFIIFSFSIPNFSEENFRQFQIIPITINKTSHISIPESFAILSQEKIKFLHKPCKNIQDSYYCEQSELKDINENCINNILKNTEATCKLIEEPIQDKIQIIYKQYIIINTISSKEYSTTCKGQTTKEFPAQSLIKFYNCSITIEGITYNNQELSYNHMFHTIPFHDIKVQDMYKPIKLIEMSNLTINNMKEMQQFRKINIPTHHHYASWSLTTTVIMTIILYLCILRYCPSCTPCQWYKKIKAAQKQDFVEDNKKPKGEELHSMSGTSSLFPNLKAHVTRA